MSFILFFLIPLSLMMILIIFLNRVSHSIIESSTPTSILERQLTASGQLIKASKAGDSEEVLRSLVAGATSELNPYGNFALELAFFCASSEGQLEIIRELLNAGADVHAKNDYALRLAVLHNHPDVAAFLREYLASENPTKGE